MFGDIWIELNQIYRSATDTTMFKGKMDSIIVGVHQPFSNRTVLKKQTHTHTHTHTHAHTDRHTHTYMYIYIYITISSFIDTETSQVENEPHQRQVNDIFGYPIVYGWQWFAIKIEHEDSSLSNVHQGGMPFWSGNPYTCATGSWHISAVPPRIPLHLAG